jgi:hypothetical protein
MTKALALLKAAFLSQTSPPHPNLIPQGEGTLLLRFEAVLRKIALKQEKEVQRKVNFRRTSFF